MRRRLLALLLLAAVLALAALALLRPRAPLPAGVGGAIVFVSDRDGVPALYWRRLPKHRARRLTFGSEPVSDPAASPDATRVAFAMNGRIGVVAVASGEVAHPDAGRRLEGRAAGLARRRPPSRGVGPAAGRRAGRAAAARPADGRRRRPPPADAPARRRRHQPGAVPGRDRDRLRARGPADARGPRGRPRAPDDAAASSATVRRASCRRDAWSAPGARASGTASTRSTPTAVRARPWSRAAASTARSRRRRTGASCWRRSATTWASTRCSALVGGPRDELQLLDARGRDLAVLERSARSADWAR